MKILLEVVKTTVAMEETIGRHVLVLLDRSGKVQPSKPAGWDTEAEDSVKPTIRVGYEKGTYWMIFYFITICVCCSLIFFFEYDPDAYDSYPVSFCKACNRMGQ